MYCKFSTKAKKSNGLRKESQGRNIENSALCRHAGLHEDRIANSVVSTFFVPQNTGNIFIDWDSHFFGYVTPRTHYSCFLDGSLFRSTCCEAEGLV